MKRILIAAMFGLLFVRCSTAQSVDNAPVAALDLQHYLGDWYEIARFDHVFERGLEFCKANYALREDGTIAVTNTGIKESRSQGCGRKSLQCPTGC